jgi:hypothetical protein
VHAAADVGVDCSRGGSSGTAGSEERTIASLKAAYVGGRTGQSSRGFRLDTVLVDPGVDGGSVEVEPLAPLDERDAALGHEPAHVSNADPEVAGDPVDVEEW